MPITLKGMSTQSCRYPEQPGLSRDCADMQLSGKRRITAATTSEAWMRRGSGKHCLGRSIGSPLVINRCGDSSVGRAMEKTRNAKSHVQQSFGEPCAAGSSPALRTSRCISVNHIAPPWVDRHGRNVLDWESRQRHLNAGAVYSTRKPGQSVTGYRHFTSLAGTTKETDSHSGYKMGKPIFWLRGRAVD